MGYHGSFEERPLEEISFASEVKMENDPWVEEMQAFFLEVFHLDDE